MNHVRITQLDGKLPNLALMRISAWHRSRGDSIHFTRSPHRHAGEPNYYVVYGSAVFKFSEDRIAKLKADFPDAIVGGTGSNTVVRNGEKEVPITLESLDWFSDSGLDYELYPDFLPSIGFTQRGCRLSCKFCVVPGKEGRPRSVATIDDIYRGSPWPKKLHLLDNDFFGAPGWQDRVAEIRDGGFKVSFTQGINVRAMTDEVAAALATIQYRDDGFTRRTLYTAWDNLKDEEVFFRGVDTLKRHGVPPKHLMAFMLVGFDKKETWERIFHRFNRMVACGIRPYPMVFDQNRRDLKRFQRWVVTGLYRAVPWEQYNPNYKTPQFEGASP